MRWLRDVTKYPVGTNGGSGFKFPHWKSIGLTPRGSSDSETRGGRTCAEQAELASPTARWPFHTHMLVHLDPARQSTAAKAGVWHIGSCMGNRQQPCTPEKAQCPEDLNRNSQRERLYQLTVGFKQKSAVFHKRLLLSQMTQHPCAVMTWQQLLVIWVAAFLYVFNRNLITLPFLAFITCSESTLQLDPVKI